MHLHIGESKGAQEAPPGSKFFHFHAVFGNKKKLAHPLWELTPPQKNLGSLVWNRKVCKTDLLWVWRPCLGNPESATGLNHESTIKIALIDGDAETGRPLSSASGGSEDGAPGPPPTVQNFLNFMQFWEILTKSYVASPRVGAPSYRESWTRPCQLSYFLDCQVSQRNIC